MGKFYSFSDCRPIEFAPSGDSMVQEYELEYSPYGVPHLVPTGEYDLYDVIQSFKDECDLGKIFQRYANGDVMALNKRQGVYEDVTDLPTDVFAATELIKRVENIYDSLDEDKKSRVGTFEQFIQNPLAAYDTPDTGSSEGGTD